MGGKIRLCVLLCRDAVLQIALQRSVDLLHLLVALALPCLLFTNGTQSRCCLVLRCLPLCQLLTAVVRRLRAPRQRHVRLLDVLAHQLGELLVLFLHRGDCLLAFLPQVVATHHPPFQLAQPGLALLHFFHRAE